MNTGRRMPPQASGPRHKAGQPPSQHQHRAGVMQIKAAAAPQSRQTPKAPPVYRPQPVPKVLQTKARFPHQPLQANCTPQANAAYRPNQPPGVLQPRMAGAPNSHAANAPRQPVAPPVYCPAQKKVAQPKMPVVAQPRKNSPTASPAYHPQPKLLQPKPAPQARAGASTQQKPPMATRRSQGAASARLPLQPRMATPKPALQKPRPSPVNAGAAIQPLRIGKIPSAAFRNANIASRGRYNRLANNTVYHHDVADFTAPMRTDILNANDGHFTAHGGVVANPLPPPGNNFASDESSTQLWRHAQIRGQTAEIDHIIPYQHWGCNDFQNARVISSQENNPGPVSRPAANDFRVLCLDRKRINGILYDREEILDVNQLNDLLGEAANAGYVGTHDGIFNPLGAENQMTSADFHSIYYGLPQE